MRGHRAVAVASAAPGEAAVLSDDPLVVKLKPKHGSGVSGTATLTQLGDRVRVVVKLNKPVRGRSPSHIHKGRCRSPTMRTTIDAAGRIIVTKPLRDELGLKGGDEVRITARDGRIELEVPPTPMRLEQRGDGVVAVPERDVPPLTAETVRETLERVRR